MARIRDELDAGQDVELEHGAHRFFARYHERRYQPFDHRRRHVYPRGSRSRVNAELRAVRNRRAA